MSTICSLSANSGSAGRGRVFVPVARTSYRTERNHETGTPPVASPQQDLGGQRA